MTTTQRVAEPQTEAAEVIAPELRIVEWQNEWIVRSSYEYDFQAPDDFLTELREKYELDDVIGGGRAGCLGWSRSCSARPPSRSAS